MIGISAQISLYPLGQDDLTPAIQEVLDMLSKHSLPYQVGSMSTVTWGDDEIVFCALQKAFAKVTDHGSAVMTITVSNACPLPRQRIEESSDD